MPYSRTHLLGETPMPRAAPSARWYAVHGVWVRVTSTSAALAEAVCGLLAPFAAPDRVRGARAAVTVRLTERESPALPAGRADWFTYPPLRCTTDGRHGYTEYDGHYVARLTLSSGVISVWAPPVLGLEAWMLSHAVVMPLLAEALRGHGLASLHAAALCEGGRAVLLPGESRSGKSTLTLALLRGGFSLLSDDAPFARREAGGVVVSAFAEPINVTRATSGFFAELAPRWRAEVADARGKVALTAADVGGDVAVAAPAALVLFPTIGQGERSSVAPLAKSDALRRMLGASMPAINPARGIEQFLLLADLVRQSDCYALSAGRDFDATPALVRRLLHTPRDVRDSSQDEEHA
jgi:hypothetical protein